MKIYTRKGDSGDTSLIDGKIVYKHNLSVAAYGTIDELNSFLGLLKDYIDDEKIKDVLNINPQSSPNANPQDVFNRFANYLNQVL